MKIRCSHTSSTLIKYHPRDVAFGVVLTKYFDHIFPKVRNDIMKVTKCPNFQEDVHSRSNFFQTDQNGNAKFKDVSSKFNVQLVIYEGKEITKFGDGMF